METKQAIIYECSKCGRKSISFKVSCPVCDGDMQPSNQLETLRYLNRVLEHIDDLAENRARLPIHRLESKVIVKQAQCMIRNANVCTCA